MNMAHDLSPDELLTTTRAVRRRTDFDCPIADEVIRECLAVAQQAPTPTNDWLSLTFIAKDGRNIAGYRRPP